MKGKKILVVDDEVELVKGIRIMLEKDGYEVIVAYDGQEALKKARREKPDLIILDVMLPKMDGYKVCALLKHDTKSSSIPIILFTARAHEEDIKAGEEVHADAYITKPFKPEVLIGKIEELLSG